MRDSILGCILGGAIGDAAGSAFEGSRSGGPWRITDDTQLTLATCEALASGALEAEAVAASMLRWFRARRITGIGASTLKALRDLDAGCHWALAGRQGERAAGNGAAMRIAPLAFCVDPFGMEGRRLIRDVCRITHHNEEAYAGALAVVVAIRGGDLSGIPDSVVRDRLLQLGDLCIVEAARLFGSSGFVAESVPLAILAAGQVARIGFEAMLEQVIAAGGDTDSNASIACQIAGARLGLSGLPKGLLARLPEREEILAVAERFAAFCEASC